MLRHGVVALALCSFACQGNVVPDPAPTKAEAAPSQPAKAEPAKVETPASPAASPPGGEPKKLGSQLRDPRWFHPGIWRGATVTKTGRSEVDANGLFSSQILFDLPEGITDQACIDGFVDKLKGEVPDMALDPKSTGTGRLIARGTTEHIKVTVVCGEAKGAMKAYLGYQWIKLPESPAP